MPLGPGPNMEKARKTLRRSFLLGAGGLGVASLAKRAAGSPAREEAPPAAAPKPGKGGGMATGLTLLNFYRDGELSLAVKTHAGVIDVKAAGPAPPVRGPPPTADLIRGR